MGALLCGVERKAAAEFSFFLAVPTMLAASVYDLYKAHKEGAEALSAGLSEIAVGFVVSFVRGVGRRCAGWCGLCRRMGLACLPGTGLCLAW